MHAGSLWSCPALCDLLTVACQASLSAEFSRQECWNVLASTGRRFLLPSPPAPLRAWCCQSPVAQAAAPPPHPALTGADPGPPGQPQEQTPVDDPRAEGNKTTIESQGSVAKEGDPKPPRQLYELKIKSTQITRQTLSLRNI